MQDDYLPLIDILTPNRAEASSLSGLRVIDNDSALAARRKLQERGARTVIITLGRDLEYVVRFAAAAAGISVTRRSAQTSIPSRAEIEAALE